MMRPTSGSVATLVARGFGKPICVVHPLFAEDSFKALSGVAGRVVSTDTVPHETNAISVAVPLARGLKE
jgi:ribose-phosphate pyrophosphokinase